MRLSNFLCMNIINTVLLLLSIYNIIFIKSSSALFWEGEKKGNKDDVLLLSHFYMLRSIYYIGEKICEHVEICFINIQLNSICTAASNADVYYSFLMSRYMYLYLFLTRSCLQ